MSDGQKQDDKKFQDPNIAINRVYTRKGDAGTTRLVGGQKVKKSHDRIETYGTVDELNSVVGAARQTIAEVYAGHEGFEGLSKVLFKVQHQLFNLGSVLATLPEDVGPKMPRVDADDVAELEGLIDQYNEELPPLRSFVLPGGTRLNVELHLARTVCRRAERLAVKLGDSEEVDAQAVAYLNRLSDAFFVFSRWASVAAGSDEVLWDPNV